MYPAQELARANASFMSRVYYWMMLGLTISGLVAYGIASTPDAINLLLSSKFLFFGIIILQFAAVIFLSACINRISSATCTLAYLAYATLSGITFSVIFMAYTQESIATAFFITAFAFTGLSAFGYLTKRDLGPLGSFCMTGLFGLIGFMLVSFIFPSIMSNALSMTINALAILIFAGLTAYDTQKIKKLNALAQSPEQVKKATISGALTLYLDFINLFISILRLTGGRR